MMKTNTFVQFELIPTLRLEAMQGLSLKTSNFTLNCLFNNYNVFIPGPIVFGNIVMVNLKEPTQFETNLTLRLETMRGLSLETSNFVT